MPANDRVTSKSDQIDKQKRRRFDNQIKGFENDFDEVRKGDENPLAVDDRMETALSNIDETITTLQTRKEAKEEKLNSRKKTLGKKNLKTIKNEEFHDLKMYELQVDLREIAEEIKDWRGYQIEIQDLSREMLRMELEKLKEDEVDVEAAKRYVEVVDDKLDNIKDIIESWMEDKDDAIDNRIDAKVGQNRAEIESKVASMEKDVEYLQKNVLTVFESVMSSMEELAQAVDNPQVQDQIQQTSGKVEDVSNRVERESRAKQVNEEVDRPEGKPQKIERTHEQKDPAEQGYPVPEENEGSDSIEGTEVGSGEDEEEEDDGPRYELKYRALSEMKEEFEKMYDELDEEELTYRKVAEKSDVGKDSIKKKIETVREEYPDQDICPPLGKKKN